MVLTPVSGSSADSQSASPPANPPAGGDSAQKFWEFADLGFDTGKKLWFVQFYNAGNENVGTYFARTVVISKGWAAQYQWKDAKGGPFWHVRERFYASEIERLSMDPGGGTLTIVFKEDGADEPQVTVPTDFAYLLYAYHLTSKDAGRAPMGFVEFFGPDGSSLGRVDNRWIIIEGVERRTSGDYPSVRIRVERKDIGTITVSGTTIIVKGMRPVRTT
jgi:hypothetical protein